MCNEKKDFSLLRPFDLEAAKRGDEFLFIPLGNIEQRTRKLVSEKNGQIVMDCGEHFQICTVSFAYSEYKMAPLCWVRTSVEDGTLKPVYKGDVLYSLCNKPDGSLVLKGESQQIRNITKNGFLCSKEGWNILPQNLAFTPPKVKRKIKMLGYKNVYDGHILLRDVIIDPSFSWERFPQIDTTVEIEE